MPYRPHLILEPRRNRRVQIRTLQSVSGVVKRGGLDHLLDIYTDSHKRLESPVFRLLATVFGDSSMVPEIQKVNDQSSQRDRFEKRLNGLS